MSEVLRTDLLNHGMNAGKEQKVFDLLRAWHRCAVLVGREQWRLFFEEGALNKNHRNEREPALAEVVGILDSYLSNRQSEFTRIVERSTLDKEIRHQLHFINGERICRCAIGQVTRINFDPFHATNRPRRQWCIRFQKSVDALEMRKRGWCYRNGIRSAHL